MAIEYNFTLDMDRSKRDNNIAYARTGDVDSITINADLVLNGTAYTPTGTNAFFECITPNGHSIRVAASKTGSAVSVDVPSAAFQAAGVINVAYFRFESGDASNPTYVESTEPFAIVVREGIGDVIDAGDYIEEWRQLADQLEAIVAEVEQKAEQAETAINEQKAEVDQLKAQVQVSMAQDAEDVSDAKDTAISDINGSQEAVDAAIDKLEQKTQEAVDAAQEALDGTLVADLQNKIDRTLKLDVADMVNISNNASLSSLTAVGSYCCKTAAAAATISDSPVDDSPFNMYVFSSSTSGQVMQLVVPVDLNGKPVAEWHVRFGTSSAMDQWSVIGGGADISAGLGIDVAGDAQKTVSIDTTAFYQHHEAVEVIQGSTEVTGGGRIKGLTVYGNTRQNLWVNPYANTINGITLTNNGNGSFTISGTATGSTTFSIRSYVLRPGSTYTASISTAMNNNACASVYEHRANDTVIVYHDFGLSSSNLSTTFTVDKSCASVIFNVYVPNGVTVSGTYRIMLNEGSEPEPWCPPGLNGVDELSVVTAGKNLLARMGPKLPYTAAGITFSDNGDGGIRISGTASATAFYNFFNAGAMRVLRITPGTYVASLVGGVMNGINLSIEYYDGEIGVDKKRWLATHLTGVSDTGSIDRPVYIRPFISIASGRTVDTVLYPQLELGSTATPYEPPAVTTTPIDLDGRALNSLPDGTRDELRIDGTGAVTLVQRVGVALYDGTSTPVASSDAHRVNTMCENDGGSNAVYSAQMCDKLPVAPNNTTLPRAVVSTHSTYGISAYTVENPGNVEFVKGLAPMKMLYALAVPQEVELPGVSMPDLASPSYIIYASSNVPAEIEAEVVKVDYLPAPDVYTKQEVDQKIEAGSMPDIVPVSHGGTGVTTAAAERNRLGLGNTTGALPVANGGTGATTAKAAQNALLGDINAASAYASDETLFVGYYGSPSDATGALYKRTGLNVWNWIVSKIRSTFGFNASNVLLVANGGTSATSAASARSNLNVYSKAEVDGKVPKVVYGAGNIPSDAENGTIYIQYRS